MKAKKEKHELCSMEFIKGEKTHEINVLRRSQRVPTKVPSLECKIRTISSTQICTLRAILHGPVRCSPPRTDRAGPRRPGRESARGRHPRSGRQSAQRLLHAAWLGYFGPCTTQTVKISRFLKDDKRCLATPYPYPSYCENSGECSVSHKTYPQV